MQWASSTDVYKRQIDYCLAQTVSLQFWAMLQKDRADAWAHYMAYTKQGGCLLYTSRCV